MRAAAYYERGLLPAPAPVSPGNRARGAPVADTVAEAVKKQPYVFFSPGLARVRMRDDLPADLARKITNYEKRRTALKKELYDVVFAAERHMVCHRPRRPVQPDPESPGHDDRGARKSGGGHPRDLAQLPPAHPTDPRWSIPRAITERIDVMLEEHRSLRTQATAKVEAIRRREPTLDITYVLEATDLRL